MLYMCHAMATVALAAAVLLLILLLFSITPNPIAAEIILHNLISLYSRPFCFLFQSSLWSLCCHNFMLISFFHHVCPSTKIKAWKCITPSPAFPVSVFGMCEWMQHKHWAKSFKSVVFAAKLNDWIVAIPHSTFRVVFFEKCGWNWLIRYFYWLNYW